MKLRVLFFGQLREAIGMSEQLLDWTGEATLAAVHQHYAALYPQLAALSSSIVMARNQEFAAGGTAVADGDELAFLPPVSGGSGDHPYFVLTRQPIDTAALRQRVLQDSDGAFVLFEGVVRDNTKGRSTLYLDYECYEALAIKTMVLIGEEIAAAHAIDRIAIVHRLGRMQVGEASVAIAVSAPHRAPAFAAALEGINRLKKTVPIWKKEYFADGAVWVEGEWDDSLPRS